MPCCEKFKESLVKFKVDQKLIIRINDGYEDIVSKSPKTLKAAYFKRAMDIMDETMDKDAILELMDWNSCCKSGAREKSSKLFAKENAALTLEEKLEKIAHVPNMGKPKLNDDGTIAILAVEYYDGSRYCCACSNFNKVKRDYPVSKSYCFCCSGHFRYHYEIMLGVKLKLKKIVSSPLDTDGKEPCSMLFEIV